MSVSVDFFSALYDSQSCYADRLTPEQIKAIHVPTNLDDSLRKWLLKKKDVILLGNPGDGKTHLIRSLRDTLERVNAEVELDATAEADYGRIVKRWKAAEKTGRPFCLAANQGPLNMLLAKHSSSMPRLEEVQEQLRHPLCYSHVPKQPRNTIVVDLNLRSILTRPIIQKALTNLLNSKAVDECPECFAEESNDVALNRRALLHPQVQDRLLDLLIAASYTGHHISMRDLQGFLSYVLLGGRTVSEIVRNPSDSRYRYFNLCFEGEGEIFDAVRDVLEPERATLPEVDEHLWENTGVSDGWLFGRPPFTPDHLDDAWELFRSMKRQYFFEHTAGDKLLGLQLRLNVHSFEDVASDPNKAEQYLPQLLKSINQFFCPTQHENGHCLRLWGAQQYDGHSPQVLASCYTVPKDKFELEVPRLNPWLTEAMEYRPDHLLLRYKGDFPHPIGLRIDRGLWRALTLTEQGLPMCLRSPQYSKLLQTFVTWLCRSEARNQPRECVFVYNADLGRLTQVWVDRKRKVYVQS